MARTTRRTKTLAALAALTATGIALSGCTAGSADEGGDGDTLKLWHYEGADSAMGKAWAEAIAIFEEETGATVEFEEKSFEQIQKTASQGSTPTRHPTSWNSTRAMRRRDSWPPPD